MKFKLLLFTVLSISLTACGWGRNNNATVDDLETAISAPADDLFSAGQPQITPPAITPLPASRDPGFIQPANEPDNFAPLPQPVVTEPITPTPQINIGTQEALRAEAGDRIFFQTNAATLDGRAQAILGSVAGWLNQNPQRNLSIEGHADERGTREYNLALGERRATAVKNYLIAQGVSAGRLNAISFGKERPAAGGSNPRAWALNRRSVFIVR